MAYRGLMGSEGLPASSVGVTSSSVQDMIDIDAVNDIRRMYISFFIE